MLHGVINLHALVLSFRGACTTTGFGWVLNCILLKFRLPKPRGALCILGTNTVLPSNFPAGQEGSTRQSVGVRVTSIWWL